MFFTAEIWGSSPSGDNTIDSVCWWEASEGNFLVKALGKSFILENSEVYDLLLVPVQEVLSAHIL